MPHRAVSRRRGNSALPERSGDCARRAYRTGCEYAPHHHGDGELRAQLVWQAICWLAQLIEHDVLALALLVVVAAPVGGTPGTTHVVWQVAACALQTIMQFVVVEVCARRMPRADAAPVSAALASMAMKIANRTADRRMTALPAPTMSESS